jgi:WD40 repeat protein
MNTSCPAPEQLAALLAEKLSDEDRQAVEAHVETCAACQAWLARATADPDALYPRPPQETIAGPPPATPADLLDRLKALPPVSGIADVPHTPPPAVLPAARVAPPAKEPVGPPPWLNRRQSVLTVLIIGLAVAGIAFLLQTRRLNDAMRDAEAARQAAEAARATAEEGRDREADRAYPVRLGLAQHEIAAGRVLAAFQLLEECPPSRRGWEWRYLRGLTLAGSRFDIYGHAGAVEDVTCSPDSKLIATADSAGGVRIWDMTGTLRHTLRAHGPRVSSVAFSSDGKRLVSVGDDSGRVWDVETGQELFKLETHEAGPLVRAAFRPNSGSVMAVARSGCIVVWDAAGRAGHSWPTGKGPICGVAWSSDGRWLATGTKEGTAILWDAETGQRRHELNAHPGSYPRSLMQLTFSPDSRRLLTVGNDHTWKLWDIETHRPLLTRPHGESFPTRVAFSPDGQWFATGGGWDSLRLWDAETGEQRSALAGHTAAVLGLACNPDARHLISAGADSLVRVWDVRSGPGRITLRGLPQRVRALAFNDDGSRLTAVTGDGRRTIWDTRSGVELKSGPAGHEPDDRALSRDPGPVAFSSDGQLRAIAAWDAIRLSEPRTGRELFALPVQQDVSALVFSPDGRRLAAVMETTVQLWDARPAPDPLTVDTAPAEDYCAVAFHPEGRLLAVARRHPRDLIEVTLWDVQTRQPLASQSLSSQRVYLAWNAAGRLFAVEHKSGRVTAWEGEHLTPLPVPGTAPANDLPTVARHPDGRRLAVAAGRFVWLMEAAGAEEMESRRRWAGFDRSWHMVEADEAEKAGRWFAAAFHLELLARELPADPVLKRRLEKALAERGAPLGTVP